MIGTLKRCINSLQLYDDESSQESNETALQDASLHLRKVNYWFYGTDFITKMAKICLHSTYHCYYKLILLIPETY